MRLCVLLILLYCLVASLFGGQSVAMVGRAEAFFTDPAMLGSAPVTIEFQIHNWTLPASQRNFLVLSGSGLRVALTSTGLWMSQTKVTDTTGATPFTLSLADRTNILVRYRRDYANLAATIEVWNVDGSGYVLQEYTLTGTQDPSASGGATNTLGAGVSIGFLRVSSTLVAAGSRPPTTFGTADIHNYKFDGNTTDETGVGTWSGSFSFEATPDQDVVASIPKVSDTPVWAPFRPIRAGHPDTLDGSQSYTMADDSADAACLWIQLSGPSTLQFSSRTSCTPTVTGAVFGPYKVRLVATSSTGGKATGDLDFGAVAYDDNGVVIYPDSRLEKILGPAMVFGANPWEWADRQHYAMAEFNWANYKPNGGDWEPEWLLSEVNTVPREGTVYTSSGATNKIFGVGTNFLEVFCGGVVGPTSSAPLHIVVNLPPDSPGDEPKRYYRYITSCQSDTEMTFNSGWVWERPHIDSPGVSWGTLLFCSTCATWGGTSVSSDVNYYDNALGHYSLYYRSGSAKARDAARWMVDRHPFSPWWGVTFIPRHVSLTAAFLRAAIDTDGLATNTWPVIRGMVSVCNSDYVTPSADIDDVRESAYCLAFTALDGLLDPDNTTKTGSRDALVTGYTNRWGPQQQANGNYINKNGIEGDTSRVHTLSNGSTTVSRFSGSAYESNYCGTVATEAGTISIDNTDRVTVTGTGTDFTGHAGKIMFIRGTLDSQPWSQVSQIASVASATSMTLAHPWRGDDSSVVDYRIMSGTPRGGAYYEMFMGGVTSGNVITGDQDVDNWYWCRYVDGNTLTLDKPYTGDTSTNPYRRMTWQNLTGRGSQPFMQGILAWALYLAADALDGYDDVTAANYRTQAGEVVDWLWSYGRHDATKGMRYGVGFSNCQSPGYSPAFRCWENASNIERSYNIEVINAFARKYLHTANATDLTRLETLYTDTYAKTGFSSPISGDGYWAEATDEGAYDFNFTLQTKNYGQAWGVGGGQTAPAARVGGPTEEQTQTIVLSFLLSDHPTATKVIVTLVNAQGVNSSTTCNSSPCNLTAIVTAGANIIRFSFQTALDAVVAETQTTYVVQ